MKPIRYPSPLEISYLNADTRAESPFINQFAVAGSGDLDSEQLLTAVEAALTANPALNAQLGGRWGWRRWQPAQVPVSLRELEASHWQGLSNCGAPTIEQPINPRQQHPIELVKVKTAYETILFFRIHHGLTDGRGTVHFMTECFRALRGEPLLGSNTKLSDWDIYKASAAFSAAPSRPTSMPRLTRACQPVVKGTLNAEQSGQNWHSLSFTGSGNHLVARLLLALAQISRANFGNGKQVYRIPADLRRHSSHSEAISLANCTGALDLEIDPDSSLRTIREQIIGGLRSQADLSPFSPQQRWVRWLPAPWFRLDPHKLVQLYQQQKFIMSGTVSSLGTVSRSSMSTPNFDAQRIFGIPINLKNRPLFLACCSDGDHHTLSAGCPAALATHSELAAFCESLAAALSAT